MRWLPVLLAISCGSQTPPPPAPPTPAPAVPRDAAVAVVVPPDATPVPPPGPCDEDETSFECRCEKGEPAGCVGLAESELRGGQNDIAIARVLPLCEQGVVEACFAAAKFLKQRNLAKRHGQSSADLTAKGMTILEQRCSADSSDSCLQLGRILLAGKVVPKDTTRGREVVDKACTGKNVRACAYLGSMYVAGEGVKKDIKRGTKLLEEACTAGGSNACAALANVIAKKNKRRAQELYAKACAGDDGEGCARSGNVVRACELEHAESCMAAAAKETDAVKQRTAYQRACDAAIAGGCVALAAYVAMGKGGPRDYGAGIELAETACKEKQPKACALAKELRASPPAVSCKTIDQCEPLCEEKIPAGCRALAEATLAQDPTSCSLAEEGLENACKYSDAMSCIERGHVDSSYTGAATWYGLGCSANHAGACALAAFATFGGGADVYRKSVAVLAKACKSSVGGSCALYAEYILRDKPAEGVPMLETACENGNPRACRVLGRGMGDDKLAHALFTRACSLGDPVGCALAKDRDADIDAIARRCMIDFSWAP